MEINIAQWIDGILSNKIPEEVVALNFNLYEDNDNCWSIELVGTSRFDLADEQWACDEVCDFGTREEPLEWEQECTWEEVLEESVAAINQYLEDGKYAELMKQYQGVGVGFIDGNIAILHFNN